MSQPPVKTINDPAARRGREDESERSFTYFTPAKRRATLYEDVTVDTQPSIHRHMLRGWLVSFEDGRGTWNDDSTALRSTDWYDFRDPGEWWERPFYQVGSRFEVQIEGALRAAERERLFDDFRPEWVAFLKANLQVPAFAEQGVWLGTASAARDCLSDSLTRAVALEAALKQRLAQSLVLYAMDLEPHFGPFPVDEAKQRWLEHPAWQPTRRFVERLHHITDWGEVVVAANLCYEPIVGAAIRRELGIRAATVNGDTVTPVVAHVSQLESAWIADWTAAFTNMMLADEKHGAHNREVIAGWLGEWIPMAEEATAALGGVIDELPVSFSFDESWARIARDASEYHGQAGVGDLVKVSA
jgi:propane 2-monooxygenase small subunit